MAKNQNRNSATQVGAMALVAALTACGGGASPNLQNGQKIGNVVTPDRTVEISAGAGLAVSAIADTRGPDIASHRWSIAPKSDSALRAKPPTIQNADCAHASTSKKPIAGATITIAQSRCNGWMVVPVTAVDATWTVTSSATGSDGTTSSASFDLVVRSVPLPRFEIQALANADPVLDQPVTLTGLVTTDIPATIKYGWSQMAGPTVTLGGADSATARWVPSVAGEYVFLLTGTWELDDLVRIATDVVPLRVMGPQASDFDFTVQAAATPATAPSASPVTLSASVSTRAGAAFDSISYQWTPLFGPNSTSTSTTLPSIILAPELPGKYVWTVQATLKSGSHTETRVSHARFEVLDPP
ncbi:hypothetical protein D5047_11595 [Verminephrobacter eiseniae]|nr:hypothetical protein [Verminephrobacter eiseniae]